MKTLCSTICVLFILLAAKNTISRPLLSDGTNSGDKDTWTYDNPIRMIRGEESMENSAIEEVRCEQMYGFLPCSETATGHLFLIVIYQYLLFRGESYVASGGERIFKILGPGVFGASAFQLIGSLPEALILLASGLLSDQETAQECVLTGVGLLAGSTILLLTVIWGTCVIVASNKFPTSFNPNKTYNCLETFLLSLWPGRGAMTDSDTSYTAGIMLLSVIPLMIMQIPRILPSSYVTEHVFLPIVLLGSAFFMVAYFIYQFFQPWIQTRRLLYVKHEHLVIDVLKHIERQTTGRLLTENGSPNVATLRKYFENRDRDGDKVISFSELKDFLQEIQFRNLQSDKDNTTKEIMKEFDIDSDDKINMDEFVKGMTKWLDDTKDAMNKRYHSVKSMKDMYKVLKPWIQKKREEREVMRHLIPDILLQLQSSAYGSLMGSDGAPDIHAIKRLFRDIDLDKDDSISYVELKELMNNIKFGTIPCDAEVAASKIMEELDISGDQLIDEEEFVTGLCKWLNTIYTQDSIPEENEDNYKKTWEQTDKLVEHKFIDKSSLARIKAVSLVVLGILVLGILAEPLVHSVQKFSEASGVSSFFVAFIFVPLASNARLAVSAISEARRKKLHTTSLTLSEIYGTVFVNNVLGLVVLLSLIFFRGLSWKYSAEVLMVLVVSVIVGCLASLSTIFSVWTSMLAYLLYPLSLILLYIFGDSN